VLIGFAVPEEEALRGTLAGAAFPFCIGVAYMILHFFTNREGYLHRRGIYDPALLHQSRRLTGVTRLTSIADHELVARAASSQDAAAFGELVRRHQSFAS
jgi:hypothetical protein